MSQEKTAPCLSLFTEMRPDLQAPRTVICMGTPRGGTSMVAGAIGGLGVFMGDNLKANIEDPLFNPDVDRDLSFKAFKARLPEVIAARDRDHRVWGWKYPRANRYLEEILPLIRNPHLVIVHRDPVPATLRVNPEGNGAALTEIRRRLRMELNNLAIVQRAECPALMVSYERASRRSEDFVMRLADFLQVTPPADLTPLLEFMEPGSYKQPVF